MMNRIKNIIVIICIFCAINVYSQKPVVKTPSSSGQAVITASDTIQYAIGAFVASWMNSNGLVIENPTLFLKGMNDVFQDRPRLVADSSLTSRIQAFQRSGQKSRGQKQEQQLLASIKDKPGLGMLPSGVRYFVIKTGKGPYPTEKDTLVINMIARLADGTIVEDTYQKKQPFVATFAALFPGLADPLKLMAEGSQWQLIIPSSLAYGEKQTALIPPYSALVIDTELTEIRPAKK